MPLNGNEGVGRTQLFIAYLYKPEAQAKVLQIPVYYSHIIPSLALQACKTRDTVKSRFPNPPLIVDKGARALQQAQGPGDKCQEWNSAYAKLTKARGDEWARGRLLQATAVALHAFTCHVLL